MPLLFILLGCRGPEVREVVSSLTGKEYVRSLDAKAHRLEVRYTPKTLELLARSGIDGSTAVSDRILDSLEKAYGMGEGLQFQLRIDPLDSGFRGDFSNDLVYGRQSGYGSFPATLKAFTEGLQERIWLECDGEKIPLGRYQMENSYGMTPGRTFVLLFPLPSRLAKGKRADLTLVLDDIVPGLARRKLEWTLPVGEYDRSI